MPRIGETPGGEEQDGEGASTQRVEQPPAGQTEVPAEAPTSSLLGRGKKRAAASAGPASKKQCKCGSSTHQRTSSQHCYLNKQKGQGPGTTSTASRASNAAAGAASAYTHDAEVGAWRIAQPPDEYILTFEDAARDQAVLQQTLRYASAVVHKLEAQASQLCHKPLEAITDADVFDLVARPALRLLLGWLNEGRPLDQDEEMSLKEMYAFVATYLHCQTTAASPSRAIHMLSLLAEDRVPGAGARVMSAPALAKIAKRMPMVNPRHRATMGASQAWSETVDRVAQWRQYEKEVYESSRRIFSSSGMCVVVDDELFGSRSEDVQSKALSQRKAGKEGLKNDCVSDSLYRTFLSTKHRPRLGYNALESVQEVLEDLAHSSGGNLDGVCGTCDRGYSCKEIWKLLASFGMSLVMIADTSDHPFKLLSATRNQVSRLVLKEEAKVAEAAARTAVRAVARSTTAMGVAVDVSAGKEGSPAPAPMDEDRAEKISKTKAKIRAKAKALAEDSVPGEAARLGLVSDPSFVVRDDPRMGREIFSATATITVPQSGRQARESELRAFAFVDHQGGASKTANVVRFVALDHSATKKMENTICMVKMRLPDSFRGESDALFFPTEKAKTPEVLAAESRLTREAMPLTCWQRSAEWFVLRCFAITSTTGAQLARRDPAARALLSSRTAAAAADSGDVASEASDVDLDDLHSELDDESDDDEVEPDLEVADAECEFVAHKLVDSWFSRTRSTKAVRTGTMSKAIIMRSIKAAKWCDEIFEVGLCASIAHPYLAVSADAVALVRPPHPEGGFAEPVYAACEFKTRSARHLAKKALDVALNYGKYFSCEVGDQRWWRAVPSECRGQVVHQAVVLGLEHVLFVIADAGELCYSVLVRAPNAARETYQLALSKYKHLLQWAIDSVDRTGPPPSVPAVFGKNRHVVASHLRLWRAVRKTALQQVLPPIYIFKCLPQVIYNMLKGGLDGNTQCVAALTSPCTLELGLEPLVSLRGIKHLASNAFILSRFLKEHLKFRHDHERPLSLKTFRARLNSFGSFSDFVNDLAVELLTRETSGDSSTSSTNTASRSRIGALTEEQMDAALASKPKHHLTRETYDDSSTSSTNTASRSPIGALTEEQVEAALASKPKHHKALRKFFNEGLPKAIRLGASDRHQRASLGTHASNKAGPDGSVITVRVLNQRACIMCGTKASNQCVICKVALHVTRKAGQTRGTCCFDKFHSHETLQDLHKS